jgi:hypothetical protein
MSMRNWALGLTFGVAALATAPNASAMPDDAAIALIAEQVDEFNAKLEASGQTIRLDYPWLFVVGYGTDPYARLRTGARWPMPNVGYILDESDYTTDVPHAEVDDALVSSFDTWNEVDRTYIEAVREEDTGGNFDVLDGFIVDGVCYTIYDIFSPNLDLENGYIYPESDIVVGGWVDPDYFSECLGSANIIGVTWTFSDIDLTGDNYRDRLYVEQFYNPAFPWVTSGSIYLDFESGLMDIETIAVHENGHAHGLGHFGGPVRYQPFKLQPNGKVFNPEAVMNPYYLYGETRSLFPTDVAALTTMYTGH